jgi:hypothetical protein
MIRRQEIKIQQQICRARQQGQFFFLLLRKVTFTLQLSGLSTITYRGSRVTGETDETMQKLLAPITRGQGLQISELQVMPPET